MSSAVCRRGCCWTPHTVCARRRACACHIEWHDTRTARQKLEDYLDGLGDE